MLRDLEQKGEIILPKRMMTSRSAGVRLKVKHLIHDMDEICCSLEDLMPLNIEIVTSGGNLAEYKSLIDQYHYLGFDRTIGENIKYEVRSRNGRILACLLFGSAAWACEDRDEYIGWDRETRKSMLPYLTNNTRFLILPWVKVPDLASHILGHVSRRISRDWVNKYGHELYCLETFVECGRFLGTCYKAANWQWVGRTKGRGRNDIHTRAALPQKDIYLYPLDKKFKQKLTNRKEQTDYND
ncbi:MAG: DUF4338 domain-containing protein [Prolixibacteraceae bacterium]|nr:DUF4338 domain-containing protein [Prolixibacteraceae bacterium]